jgi:UDP-GlcNAc:undecaprenyl-phosphate/decaprenyl-phosphate GlcNAc-1-phosphate transferase
MEWVPLLAGAAVAALIVPAGLRMLAASPFPAGVLAPVAALIALGPLAALDELAGWNLLRPDLAIFGALDDPDTEAQGPVLGTLELFTPGELDDNDETVLFALPLALGAAFLGLLHDLLNRRAAGLLTAAGTLALALLAFSGYEHVTTGEYLLAVAIPPLATHLFGLVGERPGGSAIALVVFGAALLIATQDVAAIRVVGLFAGPLLVLGVYELRGRAALGRTGSNLAGALVGVWCVLALDTIGQIAALAVLAALTVYKEQFAGRW